MRILLKIFFVLVFALNPLSSFGMFRQIDKGAEETVTLDKKQSFKERWKKREEEFGKTEFKVMAGFCSVAAVVVFFLTWDLKNKRNQYFLLRSCLNNDINGVKKYAQKVNLNKRCLADDDNNQKVTFLECFIQYGNLEYIKILLDNKANPNLRDINDNTPLYYAIKYLPPENVVEGAKLLLEYGADYRNIDGKGNNIFHITAFKKSEICDRFLELKRPLEKENKFIETFLLCMKHKGKILKFKAPKPLLLEILSYTGISNDPYPRSSITSMGFLCEKNNDGKTPYDICIEKNPCVAEKIKPGSLQFRYFVKKQYVSKTANSNDHVWREKLFANMLRLRKQEEPCFRIKSIN